MCSWAAKARTHDTHVPILSTPQNGLRGKVEVEGGTEEINGAGKTS